MFTLTGPTGSSGAHAVALERRGIIELIQANRERRVYRSIETTEITEELLEDLAGSAELAPSCSNNQPWRYVFVYDPEVLKRMHGALSKGNEWARDASMIVVVFGVKEYDCLIKEREYYLFDTGMGTAFLILRATELGLVAHPIAGYKPALVEEILGIPEEVMVITLVIVGKHAKTISPVLSEWQAESEKERPQRKPLREFVHHNHYHAEQEGSSK